MENVIIETIETPTLTEPTLIEGLPGIGDVGKIAGSYLIEQLKAKKIVSIYSRFLPPQVLVTETGLVRPMQNELYHIRTESGRDVIILSGDYQGLTSEGQYDLSWEILKLAKSMNVGMIFTLGGYGVRKILDEPRVLGAATSTELIEMMKEFGVHFETGHPSSGIVGASGLLLGLSGLFDMKGVCLMGETHGFFPDPLSAKMVLKVLASFFELELDFGPLDESSPNLDMLRKRLKEIENDMPEDTGDKENELSYFV